MYCVKCKKELPDGAVFCPWCGRRQIPLRARRRRTSGSGSISKLSGRRSKPYLARLNGMTVGTFATVREAELALSRLADRTVTDRFNWTFAQVYDAWRPEHALLLDARSQARGTGTTGMESYSTAYTYCAALYYRPFRQLRRADLQSVLTEIHNRGLSSATAAKVKQLFSQLYKWAIADGIVPANLADSLIIRPDVKKPPEVFTKEEIRSIQKSGHPAAAVALVLLATGCRINELFRARTEDCTDDYFISGSKSRAGVRRTIPVSPIGLSAYRNMLQKARELGAPLLIDGYDGNKRPENYRKRDYYPMLESLGIPKTKTPHKTRHAYTTAAVASGVRPEALTEILGHSSYSTTIDIYTHQSSDQLLREAQKVNLTGSPAPNTPPD